MSSDPKGLLSILEMHGAQLLALFTRLTNKPDIAEDLLQELFLKLQSAEGFERANNRKAYAFRTAIHLAFDWRKKRRQPESLQAEPAVVHRSPLDRLVDAEQLDQVLDALEHLSDLNRQVIVLRYLQNQEYEEIAEQLNKTAHQVRGLCSKAIGQLQAMLRPAGNKP